MRAHCPKCTLHTCLPRPACTGMTACLCLRARVCMSISGCAGHQTKEQGARTCIGHTCMHTRTHDAMRALPKVHACLFHCLCCCVCLFLCVCVQIHATFRLWRATSSWTTHTEPPDTPCGMHAMRRSATAWSDRPRWWALMTDPTLLVLAVFAACAAANVHLVAKSLRQHLQ